MFDLNLQLWRLVGTFPEFINNRRKLWCFYLSIKIDVGCSNLGCFISKLRLWGQERKTKFKILMNWPSQKWLYIFKTHKMWAFYGSIHYFGTISNNVWCHNGDNCSHFSSWNLIVQSQNWKHQNNEWNTFKVKDKATKTTSLTSFWCLDC